MEPKSMDLPTVANKGLNIFMTISKLAAGGAPTWIALGVISLLVLGLYAWWKRQKRKWAEQISETKKIQDQAASKKQNQDAQGALENAEDQNAADLEELKAKRADALKSDEQSDQTKT